MIDEPIELAPFGYAPGYYLYHNGDIWSERAGLRGKPLFKKVDRTGCVLLKTSSGRIVRRSGKMLAFQLYDVPAMLEAGFKPVYNETAYVDRYGSVYSANTGERVIPQPNRQYWSVFVGGKSRLLHRVVAEAFVPNPNNAPEVDHIDCNKNNNCADNLRWVTRSENMKAAYLNGLLDDSLRKAQEARKCYKG